VRRSPVLICLVAGLLVCAVPPAAHAAPGRSRDDVQRLEDEGVRDIIVARDAGLSETEHDDMLTSAGVTAVEDLPLADTEVVRAPTGGLVEAIDALAAESGVRYAEVNGPVHAASNDLLFGQMWGLQNVGQTVNGAPGIAGADIKGPQAWALSSGAGQAVAVVDTGIDATQEDLQGAIWSNPGEAGAKATNGLDDDGDGAVDDFRGWSTLDETTNVVDASGHGTHVTGTIAARKDNGLGVAGVAPSAQVFPLRALDASGTGSDASVASAFDVAGNLGLPIVNASIEAAASQTVAAAIDRHPGTLYVLAAGNDGANDDLATTLSLCQLPEANVICVGASDANDRPAVFPAGGASNVGPTTVDLFAPGVNIASTYIPFTGCLAPPCYAFLDGTSMAAPHVSGTLALMRARNPALTGAQLKARLLASVDPRAALIGRSVTGGRLNAAAAAAAAAPVPAPPPAPAAGTTGGAAPGEVPPAAAGSVAPPIPAVAAAPVLGRPTIAPGALTARHPLTIRFRLDRPATVKLKIAHGTRTMATASVRGIKGTNRYVLRTKVGARRLARGRYRLRLQAQGATRAYTLGVTVR
jgi:thermitase